FPYPTLFRSPRLVAVREDDDLGGALEVPGVLQLPLALASAGDHGRGDLVGEVCLHPVGVLLALHDPDPAPSLRRLDHPRQVVEHPPDRTRQAPRLAVRAGRVGAPLGERGAAPLPLVRAPGHRIEQVPVLVRVLVLGLLLAGAPLTVGRVLASLAGHPEIGATLAVLLAVAFPEDVLPGQTESSEDVVPLAPRVAL